MTRRLSGQKGIAKIPQLPIKTEGFVIYSKLNLVSNENTSDKLGHYLEDEMRSKKYFLAVCVVMVSVFITGCGFTVTYGMDIRGRIQGSGNIVVEDRIVRNFDRVTLVGTGEVEITQGEEEAVTVEADDNFMRYIRTEVKNGTLTLGYTKEAGNLKLRPSRPIVFSLTLEDLDEVKILGAGNFTTGSLDTDQLEIRILGSGSVSIAELNADFVEVQILGSGDVDLTGEVDKQVVVISGSGNIDTSELRSRRAEVSIPGSGNAEVWAVEWLEARVFGSGEIRYLGNPEVDVNLLGSGAVSRSNGR
jgi:hypothetical protein